MTSLVQNAAWRFGSTLALTAVSLVSVPVFARILGIDQWGLLALFQAATAPLVLLDLGTGIAAVKYVAEAIGRGDREEANRTFQTALIFSVATGIAGALAVAIGARWLSSSVFAIAPGQQAIATTGFRLMGLNWLAGALGTTLSGALTAHGLYGRASRLRILSGVANGVSGVLAVFAGGGLVGVVLAQTAVSVAMLGLWFAAAAQVLPGIRSLPRWDAAIFRRCLSFGSWRTAASAGGLLANWSDRYILGASLSATAVGVYAVALSIVTAAYSAFHDMGEVLFPAVSQRAGAGNPGEARHLSLQAGWVLSTVFAVAAAVIAAVGGDFITLWVSAETARLGAPVLRLLCAACTIGIVITGPMFLCLGLGRTRLVAGASLLTGAVVLGLGVLLVRGFGLQGIGWAILGGTLAQWTVELRMARSVYAPDVGLAEFAVHVWSPACIGLVVLSLAVAAHEALARTPSWPGLVLETILCTALAAGLQLAGNELFPGGKRRRALLRALLAPLGIKLGASRAGQPT